MLAILSPAKSLDFESRLPRGRHTIPDFLEDSAQLVDRLREFTPPDLSKMMGISDKLAKLNVGSLLGLEGVLQPQERAPGGAGLQRRRLPGPAGLGVFGARSWLGAAASAHSFRPARSPAPAGPDSAVPPGDVHAIEYGGRFQPLRLLGRPPHGIRPGKRWKPAARPCWSTWRPRSTSAR